jgi:predicted nucleotidyltransferase component of viral defense system
MTRKEITNLSASIYNKLSALARKENADFNTLLMRYLQERFLYRLSISKYKNKFVLKGGFMLMAIDLPNTRPTMDIDFAVKQLANDIKTLKTTFKEICETKPDIDDAIIFDTNSITAEVIIETAEYNGVRLKLKAKLGSSITPMKFDIGFGDPITPQIRVSELPSMLNLPKPVLNIYPLETVVSEKLNAMLVHSLINSRMKDFYDVFMILTEFNLPKKTLKQAIKNTFASRGTELPKDMVIFREEFYKDKQSQWLRFLENNKLNSQKLNNFEFIIRTLKNKLKGIL